MKAEPRQTRDVLSVVSECPYLRQRGGTTFEHDYLCPQILVRALGQVSEYEAAVRPVAFLGTLQVP